MEWNKGIIKPETDVSKPTEYKKKMYVKKDGTINELRSCHKSKFIMPIYLQPDDVIHWNFKLYQFICQIILS